MATKKIKTAKKTTKTKKATSKSITKQVPISKRNLKMNTLAVVVIALLTGLVLLITKPNNSTSPNSSSSSSNSSLSSSQKSSSATNSNSNRAKSSASDSGSGSKGSSSSNSSSSGSTIPATTGPCAAVLTAAQAQSVIGGTVSATGSNGIASQTTDITEITCVYSSGTNSASIVEDAYNTQAGQNANEVQFGSGRPSGVSSLKGYGQSAFWQASSGLNILDNNNRYIVKSSVNGSLNEAASENLAKHANLSAQY
jgi:hypothetical protein